MLINKYLNYVFALNFVVVLYTSHMEAVFLVLGCFAFVPRCLFAEKLYLTKNHQNNSNDQEGNHFAMKTFIKRISENCEYCHLYKEIHIYTQTGRDYFLESNN